MSGERASVLIAGGGIAGLEALLALNALAEDRVDITLLARDPEFTYRPMIVEEPFSLAPAARRDLELMTRDLGAGFVRGTLAEVDAAGHVAKLDDGEELGYDVAVVCVGGKSRPAFESATTLRSWAEPVAIDEALAAAAEHPSGKLALVVPPGVAWVLPLYELALLTQRRAAEHELAVEFAIVTPEPAPLSLFGTGASAAVAELLAGRGIDFTGGASVEERDGELVLHPGGAPLEAGAVVALPLIVGPSIPGLPADDQGFIPIDQNAQVVGCEDIFAAGDGTTFPIKQGGIGTQQADAAAEMIASRSGAAVDPQPFHPILRGKLITGGESLSLRSDVGGGGGEGVASADYLWWPPQKVGGRYLAPYLADAASLSDLEPPGGTLDVEVALPVEWHREPMGLDPL